MVYLLKFANESTLPTHTHAHANTFIDAERICIYIAFSLCALLWFMLQPNRAQQWRQTCLAVIFMNIVRMNRALMTIMKNALNIPFTLGYVSERTISAVPFGFGFFSFFAWLDKTQSGFVYKWICFSLTFRISNSLTYTIIIFGTHYIHSHEK